MRLLPAVYNLRKSISVPFGVVGGTPPYTFSVVPGGNSGGVINPSSGLYTSPDIVTSDKVKVVDSLGAEEVSDVNVLTIEELFCEILSREMLMPDGRVYIWDQKIFEPTDDQLYIAVSVLNASVFGNSTKISADGLNQIQSVNMHSIFGIDIISKSAEAYERKEEIILALNSVYAEQQQELNSFSIGRLPTGFVNLSSADGAAIPYRFHLDVAVQYEYTRIKALPYYDTFNDFDLKVNS